MHPPGNLIVALLAALAAGPVALAGAAPQTQPAGRGQSPPAAPTLQPLPVTQLEREQSDPDLDRNRISLGFSRPTPIGEILLLLVRDTRLSVVPDPALDQAFVGDLKDVTVREALALMLDPLGLEFSVQGTVIRVFRRELQTRLYSVDYVADRSELYTELAQGVYTLLSADGRMHLDRTAALLQVTDSLSAHRRVDRYLELVMTRATRQVRIETQVIEVDLPDPSLAGIDWEAVRAFLAERGAQAVAPGETMALAAGRQRTLLDALAAQGRVRVVSAPRVTAMNNEPVVVQSGVESAAGPEAARLVDGFALDLTPQIAADGVVHMRIHPRLVERAGTAAEHAGGQLLSVRGAQTAVRVRDGETVVIAGLLRDEDEVRRSKVPVVGHVPLLGRLFTRTDTLDRRTDLVITLTPTITTLSRPYAAAGLLQETPPRDGPLAAIAPR